MPVSNVSRLLVLPAGAVLALGLAGCSGTTYGTGITQEQQTIEDVMTIASLGSKDAPPIDYRPRGGIVAPPNNSLPPPGSAPDVTAAIASDPNWPQDPDEAKAARRAARAAQPMNQPSPNFVLPKGQTSHSVANGEYSEQQKAEGKKAWDELHKGKTGTYDANGNPVRKYLTEPPVAYRAPDPNAPMTEPPKKKKKFNISNLWPF